MKRFYNTPEAMIVKLYIDEELLDNTGTLSGDSTPIGTDPEP